MGDGKWPWTHPHAKKKKPGDLNNFLLGLLELKDNFKVQHFISLSQF